MGEDFSYERARDSHDDALNARRAVSLLETIIVLFIIGLMMGLLFPAIQAARHRALAFQCQNNLNQLSLALSQSISTTKRFPQPNRWTVDLLRWMEEVPLADTIPAVIPTGAVFGRPKPMQCPNQYDEHSTVVNVETCDYVLVVNRPIPYDPQHRWSWEIVDRPLIEEKDPHDPWYLGPEMNYAQAEAMFASRQGPHQSGLYYDSTGRTHPDK
jgi:type II secretory pathway pseudopilin PulG